MSRVPKTSALTSVIKAEVIKPIDGEWDALGAKLRALRAPLHRAMNATVVDLELANRANDKTHPRTLAYQRMRDNWGLERIEAAKRVEKKKPYTNDDLIAGLEPSSGLVLGAAGEVYTRWGKWKKERWRGDVTLPSFRGGSPLFVAGQGASIEPVDGSAVLTLNLLGSSAPKNERKVALVVSVEGASHWAQLRTLLENPERMGSVKLLQRRARAADRKGPRKWKWFAHISYERKQGSVESGRVMAVHRSVRNFVTVSVSRSADSAQDAFTAILESGEDIVEQRRRYDARRRSLGRHMKNPGTGARGRGKKRRFEAITRLEDSHARWTDNRCKAVAAKALKVARQRGVGTILMEDWSNPITPDVGELSVPEYYVRSFPLAQCKASIEWAAKREGFDVRVVRSQYNCRTCPSCSHLNEHPSGSRFVCESCKLERPADVVAAWNMLRREGFGAPIEEASKSEKKAARRLKKGAQ